MMASRSFTVDADVYRAMGNIEMQIQNLIFDIQRETPKDDEEAKSAIAFLREAHVQILTAKKYWAGARE